MAAGMAGRLSGHCQARRRLLPCTLLALAGCASLSGAPPAVVHSGPTQQSVEQVRRQHEATPAALDFNERLDAAHDALYVGLQDAAYGLDRRFVRESREPRRMTAAPFRLGIVTEALQHGSKVHLDLDADLDLSLNLPNLQERLRLFITSNELDEGTREAGEKSSVRAGLRYALPANLDFDIGLRVDLPPAAFASVKWARTYQLGSWDFQPLLKLFADTNQSLGYAAAATFDHWSGQHLLRSASYVKWRDDLGRARWSQTFIYARAREVLVPDRYGYYLRADDIGRGWGVRLLAGGKRTSHVSRYEAGVFYRHPASRHNWLYWYVEPMVRREEEDGNRIDPGVQVGFHALFWGLARSSN